jgi:hypothetical protein
MIGTERPYQLGLFCNPQTPLTDPPCCGATLISDNCALTAAHCVTRFRTTVTLYERILLVGGSIFWNKALHSDAQTLEFPSKNNVFIQEKWLNEPLKEPLNGYGKLDIHRYNNN